ncbi:hypothetical protein LAh1_15 [Aeromonas phage LAh1]|uniref:Uncharacterized protein n=1 Tax=Aeromonas phage LAh1 TaxID=2591024 RepID=A0A513ZZ07_9CAUD|nr:hypothetical protein LAh1_15 [Aeromonas phage LAh1]QDH46360.1 hypothetical protein LAh3_15 [Aeromonas phage LAh3]QDH46410.1 hypothetical protein LAh4_16 [Aeromonas phage LAh4]QDH46463.1 hypothetical protein LAh5_17 [Aeromonas phage LAh5]
MVLDWRALLAGLWLLLTAALGIGLWHYQGAAKVAQKAAEDAQRALADYTGQVTKAEAKAAEYRSKMEKLRGEVAESAIRAEAGHGPCGAEPVPAHVVDELRKRAEAASAHP